MANGNAAYYRKQIARLLNPSIAPRVAPALESMLEEFGDSEGGYAHESDLISALTECGLMESTAKARIREFRLAGYLSRNGDGYSLIERPK